MNWYDLPSPNDPQLDELALKYQLHPLHVEDCRHRNQSAKMEEGQNYLFVVLKPVDLHKDHSLHIVDLDIFLGPDYVITVQEGQCRNARSALDEVRNRAQYLRPDQLFYRIMDGIVDSYLPTLDAYSDEIDRLQDMVIASPHPEILQKLFSIKRCLLELRRVLSNTRDVAGHLQRSDNELIHADLSPFLRDIYDHVARNMDMVELQRDLLTGSLDVYLSGVANRTNEVMKVLTVLGTVALPALVISGFYGMNLKYLPWLESPHALGIVIGLMLGTTGLLLAYLRKSGYL